MFGRYLAVGNEKNPLQISAFCSNIMYEKEDTKQTKYYRRLIYG